MWRQRAQEAEQSQEAWKQLSQEEERQLSQQRLHAWARAEQSRDAWKLRAHDAERRLSQQQLRPPPCNRMPAVVLGTKATECKPCMPAAARVAKATKCKAGTCNSNHDKANPGKDCYRDPRKLVVIPQHMFDNPRCYAKLVKARMVNAKRLGVTAKPIARATTSKHECDVCSPKELERALCSAKAAEIRACSLEDLTRALSGSKLRVHSQGGEARSQGGRAFVRSNAAVASASKQ